MENSSQKKYFHELTDKEFKQCKLDGKGYSDFERPPWYDYPEALCDFYIWMLEFGRTTRKVRGRL